MKKRMLKRYITPRESNREKYIGMQTKGRGSNKHLPVHTTFM